MDEEEVDVELPPPMPLVSTATQSAGAGQHHSTADSVTANTDVTGTNPALAGSSSSNSQV